MLSSRGKQYVANGYGARGHRSIYDPKKNPEGNVPFHSADNWLVHEDLHEFMNTHNTIPMTAMGYHQGYTGTTRIREAMAAHMNAHFHPVQPVDPENFTIGSGVTDINEVCAMLTCDPGKKEAVMLGRPIYGSFRQDLSLRTGIELEYVAFPPEVDQFDVGCVDVYEKAIEDAKTRGITVKALLLCNPHNPLGQCYTRDALIALLRLCNKHKLHVLSDEIYALSVYQRKDVTENETFTSVLSIDWEGLIDEDWVHVLYGMSKDFGAAGLRLGCLLSRNKIFNQAAWATCRFASCSELSMAMASEMLEDQQWASEFIEKSRSRLLNNRTIAQKLFSEGGAHFHEKGNAGFFLWISLKRFLPLHETNGDAWEAEMLLSERFNENGVWMAYGKGFEATEPGWFRVIIAVTEDMLKEGIKRIFKVCKASENVGDRLKIELRIG